MIVGAGLAGLIAGYVFPREDILERNNDDWVEHQAVLRFRSEAVSELTGIPFRRVTVRKGIWNGDGWLAPNVAVCNQYSQKTVGRVLDRSIWDVSPAERWVAPTGLRAMMCEALGPRIQWNTPMDFAALATHPNRHELIISTVPMSVLAPLVSTESPRFGYAPIATVRVKIPGADVFQTVYFPSPATRLYRASITGDTLICEWAGAPDSAELQFSAQSVADAFGVPRMAELIVDDAKENIHAQKFGKIAPIDEGDRRAIILALTQVAGIYSLGRFATWRNLLLDDVVHDAVVIKRLVTKADDYDRALGRGMVTTNS